jgi:hypothetical protein
VDALNITLTDVIALYLKSKEKRSRPEPAHHCLWISRVSELGKGATFSFALPADDSNR